MDLSIIIVNWNTRDLLEQCLRSVEGNVGRLKAWRVETFVVDNASTDGSAAMVDEEFPDVLLIENEENLGFAAANNRAIRRCGGRYVLLLNSDTELRPGALEALLGFMEAHPKAGGCGAPLLNGDESLQPSCHPMLTPWREFWRLTFLDRAIPVATYDMSAWDPRTPRQVEVIKGACLMLRREGLDQVGLLDENYFMYTEEMDLCYRLLQAGWQLYWVPQAEVVHYGEGSTRQVADEMYVQLYRSKVQFHRKLGGASRARLFKALVALAYAPRWLIAAAGRMLLPELKDRSATYRRLLRELPGM